MSIPDPYRQGGQPNGGYPQQPPPIPVAGQPVQPYPAQPYPGQPAVPYAPQGYPQPAYPQPGYAQPVPAQPAQPYAYQPQPAYPQPGYPQPGYAQAQPANPYPQQYAQPAYPQQPVAYQPQPVPVQPVTPQPVDFQQQAFQAAPVRPLVAQPTPVKAQPVAVQPVAAKPVAAQPVAAPQPAKPTAPVKPSGPRPIPVTPEMAAAKAATTATPSGPAVARPVLVKKSDKDKMKVEDRAADEEEEEKAPPAVKAAPPWLVSLVVHMVFLIILGLIYIVPAYKNQIYIEAKYAETLGDQLEDSTVLTGSPDNVETLDKTFSEDMKLVDDPLAAPPELQIDPLLTGNAASSDISAPSIGMALSGREKGAKNALLAAYGGTKLTEESVLAGLQWLKKNQRADGSWSLQGPYSDGGGNENATAATAMALLAFQGHGDTHREGQFKDVVAKAWKWLLAQQDADGNFVKENVYNARLYTQAQCTIAICELYGMTKDEKYQKPAQLAIDFAARAQSSEGGWRYTPGQDSDTSVTGWFVMALQSGRMAYLSVPNDKLDGISKYLDASQHNQGSQYGYKIGTAPTVPMTAEGLLCRQYLGWKHDDPRLVAGSDYVLTFPIDYTDQNVYHWYYSTQVMHHMGGPHWEKWNAVMREAVPKAQTKTGKEAGSWSPSQDRWGAHGGRLYTTCLSIYMLEVYYRHLPIYKHQN